MLKRLLFFIFYFYLCFPVPAIAAGIAGDVRSAPLEIGMYIRGQVLSCYKKEQITKVVDLETKLTAALLLFASPYPCSISTVQVYLDALYKKFKDADGTYYWIVGVSADPKPGTQFYIVLPADNFRRAP